MKLKLPFFSLFKKLSNRQAAAKRMRWGEDKAQKVQAILNVDFMSSEESEEDTAETATEALNRRRMSQPRRVRQLRWESEELKQIKKELDDDHAKFTGKRYLPVITRPAGLFSSNGSRRAPKWALAEDYQPVSVASSSWSTLIPSSPRKTGPANCSSSTE